MNSKALASILGICAMALMAGCAVSSADTADQTDVTSDELTATVKSFDDNGFIPGGAQGFELAKGTVRFKNAGKRAHRVAEIGSPTFITATRLNVINEQTVAPGQSFSMTVTGSTSGYLYIYSGSARSGNPVAEYSVRTRAEDWQNRSSGGGAGGGGGQCGTVCIGGTIDGAERICHTFPPCGHIDGN